MVVEMDNTRFSFENLKLVEKPDSSRNAQNLPQTFEGCEGYLDKWPLRAPNADPKAPTTLARMVNILTDSGATGKFEQAEAQQSGPDDRMEGATGWVYSSLSPTMKALEKESKNRTCHVKAPGITGHIVNPGCLSFYNVDGRTFAVTQGRWLLMSFKASWIARNVPIDQEEIKIARSRVLIIRVSPGCVGTILVQGSPVLLEVGTHVFNSGTVVNCGTSQYASHEHIQHGKYNYVRVTRGALARVWAEVASQNGVVSVQPRLLAEGEHFIASHLFSFEGMSMLSEEYINHGSLHRISVPKGFVAKCMQDNTPRLLSEGDHLIESTGFSFDGKVDVLSNYCISHNTITILRVTLASIALAWQNNEPKFIDTPGLYEFNSEDFQFVEFRNAEDPLIQLGPKKVIQCNTGQVAVTYDQGELKILKDGRHVIDKATHTFHSFLSVQQKSIRLISKSEENDVSNKKSKKGKISDNDLTICETKDLVKVGMRADVFYSIEDPEKCIQKIDTVELEDLVRETAIATLTNIIRSTTLNEIAQSKNVSASDPNKEKLKVLPPPPGPEAPPPTAPEARFFEKVHDEFMSKLNEDFSERYGVDIANIRIESFKIVDQELADQISKHALTTAQIENEMANLEGTSLISTTRERTAAEVLRISTEAEAATEKTKADAENQRQIDASKAEAEAHRVAVQARAQAEADAILVKAKAEAEAIRLKAAAEAERAEMLSKTSLGQQQSLLAQYTDMVVGSNQGVEKIVYLDPSVNRDSPFALGSLNNLNMDLHALSKVGVAVGEKNSQMNGKHH